MPRTLRNQYPGAVYHIMARGDVGKRIFEDDADGKAFLFRLGQVCASHGWRVHAWVLMGDHFHLLLQTPEPNRVTAMKALKRGWYLGEPTFADKLRAIVEPNNLGKAGRDAIERFHDEAEAERLGMGHPGSVSRLVGGFRGDRKHMKELKKFERMLKRDTRPH